MAGAEGDTLDIWLERVDGDPRAAIALLTRLLRDADRAREAVLSPPVAILFGLSRDVAAARVQELAGQGLVARARPARRASIPSPARVSVAPAASPAPPTAPTAAPAHASSVSRTSVPSGPPRATPSPVTLADEGRAEVAFPAALLGSFAYPFHREAMIAVVGFAVANALVTLGMLVPFPFTQIFFAVLSTGVTFGLPAIVARNSTSGRARLDLDAGDENLFTSVLYLGCRIISVSVLTGLLFFGIASTLGDLAPLVMLFATIALTLALPGTFAVLALGDGCFMMNPFVGLFLAARLPGPYLATSVIVALVFVVGGLIPFFLVGLFGFSVVGILVAMGVFGVVAQILNAIAGRMIGQLIYHYRDELGI